MSSSRKSAFDYEHMVQDALRGVVRSILEQVSKTGLPGSHHFYIAFRTDHPGVEVPAHLRERYPEEITIVLQHQFWNLKVLEDHFEVALSFNKKPENLVVPFTALSGFMDPSVQFGLQLQPMPPAEAKPAKPAPAPAVKASASEVPDDDVDVEAEVAPQADEEAQPAGSNVVTLDVFRKNAKP